MDYKEKFEDFFDKMQGLLDNAKKQGDIIIRVEDLENTLTELKEGDEDERIREDLIEYFRWNVQQLLNDFSNKEVVAWLEKQGKLVNFLSKGLDNAHERIDELIQKNNELCIKLEKQGEPNPYSGISFDYNGHTWGMCARDNGVDILLDKQLFKHLEKQDKQKVPVVDFKAEDWYVSKVDGKIHNVKFMESSEKQGKQVEINPSEFDIRLNRLLKQFESLPKEELTNSLSFYLNVVQNDGTYVEEKQDEQKNKINSYKFTFEDVLALECSMKTAKITEGGDELYEMLVPLYNKIHNAYLAEKQGEHKPVIEMKSPEESLGISSKEYNDIVNECLYGESKPADKEEPKFHEGDWVIRNNEYTGIPVQVIEFKGYYRCNLNGEVVTLTPNDVHNNFHLWSIQDAKDGDVLAEDTCIFIIKKLNDDLSAKIYCCLYDDGDFDINSNLVFDDTSTYPATKEQRDLLFKKMKEVGYEWDAEKKELKKISQRTISAEAKEALYDKPAWSEEDEDMVRYIGNAITCKESTKYLEEKGIDMIKAHRWLESFKPQLKKEWGEEDEKYSKDLFNYFTGGFSLKHAEEDIVDWLKSLKQRIGWKPSDEQMDALADALSLAKNCGEERAFDLRTLYEQLKKLKGE